MARTANGDRAALEALFARHYTHVFRFVARRTRNDGLAEEVANEVFLDVWRHASRFRGQSRVSTYLLSIAHNKTVSQLRKTGRVHAPEDGLENVPDEDDTPEVVSQKKSKSEALRAAIDALPDEFKIVIDLIYYQERSITEIAEVLDIPVDTVKTRAFRARKKLGAWLEDAGIDRGWP